MDANIYTGVAPTLEAAVQVAPAKIPPSPGKDYAVSEVTEDRRRCRAGTPYWLTERTDAVGMGIAVDAHGFVREGISSRLPRMRTSAG